MSENADAEPAEPTAEDAAGQASQPEDGGEGQVGGAEHDPSPTSRYDFGDDDIALERLELLHQVFKPSTRHFLESWTQRHGPATSYPEPVYLDLGCGPGASTRLLRDLLRGPVIGLDSAPFFLWHARRLQPQDLEFVRHDVTEVPFPTPAANLIFCRFLLSHLTDPSSRLADFASQSRPGGWILCEEVEAIDTTDAVFESYLSTVTAMLTAAEKELYIGPALHRIGLGPEMHAPYSEVHELTVTDHDAGRMFLLNLHALRTHPWVGKHVVSSELDELEQGLIERAHSLDETSSHIDWRLRQIAYQIQ